MGHDYLSHSYCFTKIGHSAELGFAFLPALVIEKVENVFDQMQCLGAAVPYRHSATLAVVPGTAPQPVRIVSRALEVSARHAHVHTDVATDVSTYVQTHVYDHVDAHASAHVQTHVYTPVYAHVCTQGIGPLFMQQLVRISSIANSLKNQRSSPIRYTVNNSPDAVKMALIRGATQLYRP